MSDDIICRVDGCKFDAGIEVVRKGASLWLCGDHYTAFIRGGNLQLAEENN